MEVYKIAVVITQSTNVRYETYSSVNGTLATAFTEVIDSIDTNAISKEQIVGTSLAFDDAGQEYIYVVLVKKGV